jgi:hypothetical protein
MKGLLRDLEGFITILGMIFLLWIVLSWGDVLMHNAPTSDGNPHSWNAFVLLTEVGK